MRKRFEQQLNLGIVPINEVRINLKSRHQLPPVLKGFPYLFEEEELSEEIFQLLEGKVLKLKKPRAGRVVFETFI